MTRRFTSLALAGALTFGLAGSAFATGIPETFSVNASLSLSGLPVSIAYGAINPGAISSNVTFDMAITSNVPWRLDTTASDFAGASALNKSIRSLLLFNMSNCAIQAGLTAFTDYGNVRLTDTVADATGNGAATCEASLHVQPPANAAAGSETGTVTWVLSAS